LPNYLSHFVCSGNQLVLVAGRNGSVHVACALSKGLQNRGLRKAKAAGNVGKPKPGPRPELTQQVQSVAGVLQQQLEPDTQIAGSPLVIITAAASDRPPKAFKM